MTEYFNIVEVPGRLTVVVGMRTRPLMKMML